jgi:hypothetical protein
MTYPKGKNKRLTYEELIETGALLGALCLRLLERFKAMDETVEFLITEMLKTKVEVYNYNKKSPYKRMEELEASLKGMNAYYQERLAELHTPPKKDTSNRYIYTSIKKEKS